MPYGQVDRLSKMIPVEGVKPVSIEKALADEPRLREEAQERRGRDRLLNYGQQVEGLLRNASTHAAGVVIGDRPLDDLVPLYQDPRSDMPATQFNMKWVEQAGLVKFDFLGLKTLTVIQNAVELIKAAGAVAYRGGWHELYEPPEGVEYDIGAIPLDDEKVLQALCQRQDRRGVSGGKLGHDGCAQADEADLYRGYRGAGGAVPSRSDGEYPDLLRGEERPKELESIHPSIDHILEETQGIIVYQEQVMQIAQVMAGYTPWRC